MNELYKAKRSDNGEWVIGGSIIQFLDDGERTVYMPMAHEKCVCVHDGETDNILEFEECKFYKVDPETLCQYAFSLNSGQKVFKHDILSGHLDDKFPENETRVEVVWNQFGWATRQSYSGYMDSVTEEDLNMWDCVCGNALDDPKLERTVE